MIILYKGARGKGKSLTMTKDAFKYYKSGLRVLRNFNMAFGELISNEEIIEIDRYSNIQECVLVIDEIQAFFDSRASSSKANRKFSNFIQQIRKRRIILLCTTQFANTIDLRLRQHLDIIAYPNFIKALNVCEVTYIDLTTLEDDIFTRVSEPKTVKIVYNAKDVYNLYDTNQLIV